MATQPLDLPLLPGGKGRLGGLAAHARLVGAKPGAANSGTARLSKRAAAAKAGFSEGLWRQLEAGERRVSGDITVPMNTRDENLRAAALAVGLEPAVVFATVGRTWDQAATEEIELSASGADLEALRLADPDAYEQVMALAKSFLDRARRRRDNT